MLNGWRALLVLGVLGVLVFSTSVLLVQLVGLIAGILALPVWWFVGYVVGDLTYDWVHNK